MKAVILAGGLGTRLAEETNSKPKPMVEIGGRPILWHILKIYSFHGITDFVICCGYKGYIIKEYFANYALHTADVTIDLSTNKVSLHSRRAEPWRITLVDTGDDTMTGGRMLRIRDYLDAEDCFCFSYGDGLSNVDIRASVTFHRSHGRYATVTAVSPPGRFGALDLRGDRVESFVEKPKGDGSMINGGFFVLSPKVLDFIEDDNTVWEQGPLVRLAQEGQLMAYKHEGYWQAMDTLRDKLSLESLWSSGAAPWKLWT